jgi:hypothetical protein
MILVLKPEFLYGLTGSKLIVSLLVRMLSSMTPTVVEKNGKLFMVVGTLEDLPLSPLFYKPY